MSRRPVARAVLGPDWPAHCSPPLVAEQALEVRLVFAATGGFARLVRVLCCRCGELIAVVDHPCTSEGRELEIDFEGRWEPVRSVLRARLYDHEVLPDLMRSRRREARDRQYLAHLETPTARYLPPRLPLWCSSHGDLSIDRDTLTVAARRARRDGRLAAVHI
jgi:hypothetical protein